MSNRRNEQESTLSRHGYGRFETFPHGDSTFYCDCGWQSPHMPTREDALAYGMEHFRVVGGFTVQQTATVIR